MREQVVKNIEKEFLEPSFKYLVKNGLENTSVRDLCKAMGVSSGSIYYWFENKDDIYISTVKYGINKVSDELFRVAFDKMQNPELFFDTFFEEVEKYKLELRLIFQVTASPVCGGRMREKAGAFKFVYDKYIDKMAEMLGCSPELLTPIIYTIRSILIDYVMWEDYEAAELQLRDLFDTMKLKLEMVQAN